MNTNIAQKEALLKKMKAKRRILQDRINTLSNALNQQKLNYRRQNNIEVQVSRFAILQDNDIIVMSKRETSQATRS